LISDIAAACETACDPAQETGAGADTLDVVVRAAADIRAGGKRSNTSFRARREVPNSRLCRCEGREDRDNGQKGGLHFRGGVDSSN